MNRPTINIKVTSKDGKTLREFTWCNECTVTSGWKFLSDTCEIKMPRKAFPNGLISGGSSALELSKQIGRGDKVDVAFGYDFNNRPIFSGYIAEVMPGTPLVFKCEDEMWQLKQHSVSAAWTSVGLDEFLTKILPEGASFRSQDNIQLGKVRLSNATAYQSLTYLKDTYGIYSWYYDGVLNVGLPYSLPPEVPADGAWPVVFQKHVVRGGEPAYQRADEVKMRFRAISMQRDGSKVEVELGDKSGEEHTMHLPIGLNKAEVERLGKERMKLFQFEGYRGSIKTIGVPGIRHSMALPLKDLQYPERDGKYLVDETRHTFGLNGIKIDIKLARKL